MFQFTEAETKVAMILVSECLAGMGGTRPIDLDGDPYTWCDPKDLRAWGYSPKQTSGFWSSLMGKGFIQEYDDNEWCVSDEGYRFVDTIWDANLNLIKGN